MLKIIKIVLSINWFYTIRFNLKLKIKDALKFPILVFGNLSVHSLKGDITIKNEDIKLGMVKIGLSSVGIFDKKVSTVINIHGNVLFKGTAIIGRGAAISVGRKSYLEFGNNFQITAKSSIVCSGGRKIVFGESNLLSWDILVMNTDFHKIDSLVDDRLLNYPEDIYIGNNVWIGCNSLILKGTSIPNNSIIAANSKIIKKLEKSYCIYTGVPERILKEQVYWKN